MSPSPQREMALRPMLVRSLVVDPTKRYNVTVDDRLYRYASVFDVPGDLAQAVIWHGVERYCSYWAADRAAPELVLSVVEVGGDGSRR